LFFYGSNPNRVGIFRHFNHDTESKSGVCRKKAQNTQRVDVSLPAPLARFLWLIVLLLVALRTGAYYEYPQAI
jgi:hypothetical protein